MRDDVSSGITKLYKVWYYYYYLFFIVIVIFTPIIVNIIFFYNGSEKANKYNHKLQIHIDINMQKRHTIIIVQWTKQK